MSGFEALGATAAVAQLSELCIKCGQTTVRIICSYRGAPKEIIELAQKVDRLKFRIGQVQKIGDDLSDLDLDDVFPEIHRVILLEQLETHHNALLEIEGLATGVGGQTRGKKLQWAFVDKRKTTRIMQDLADINQTLDQFLEIIPIRLATIQHNSIAALRASNAALMPAFLENTKEIQSLVQAFSDQQSLYWEETRTVRTSMLTPTPTFYVRLTFRRNSCAAMTRQMYHRRSNPSQNVQSPQLKTAVPTRTERPAVLLLLLLHK
ncbi:hypothetical protein QIS74_12084 [Colletotrichum tabaci]|uniref:Fungal N-terminal domain-containing protein n=1 Tax=Colletotrichum tabaci TaxID=1209068 RepID=A0AAV9SWE1_9PEZI